MCGSSYYSCIPSTVNCTYTLLPVLTQPPGTSATHLSDDGCHLLQVGTLGGGGDALVLEVVRRVLPVQPSRALLFLLAVV